MTAAPLLKVAVLRMQGRCRQLPAGCDGAQGRAKALDDAANARMPVLRVIWKGFEAAVTSPTKNLRAKCSCAGQLQL